MMRRLTSSPKPSARVLAYMSAQVACSSCARWPNLHAVEAAQVARGLGRRDDVVHGDRQLGARQRDLDAAWRRASRIRPARRRPRRARRAPRLRRRTPSARRCAGRRASRPASGASSLPRGRVQRGRVALGVRPAHGRQQQGAVLGRAGHRAGLVEAGREGDHAVARGAAVGRLDAGDAAERGRLADRAAGVGAGGARCQACGHGGGAAARGAAGNAARCPRGCAPAPRCRDPWPARRRSRWPSPSRTRRS